MTINGSIIIVAALCIVIGSFFLVFGLDKDRSPKIRKRLLAGALICLLITWGSIMFMMIRPFK